MGAVRHADPGKGACGNLWRLPRVVHRTWGIDDPSARGRKRLYHKHLSPRRGIGRLADLTKGVDRIGFPGLAFCFGAYL